MAYRQWSFENGAGAALAAASPPPGTLLFAEGFEDANLASRGWYDNTGSVLSSVEHIAGSAQSAQYRFLSTASSPTSGGAQRKLFTPTDSIYLSYWIKYSSNWVGSGQPYHPHQFHFLSDLDGDFDGLSDTFLTSYIEEHYTAGNLNPRLAFQDSKSVNSSFGAPPNNLLGVTEDRSVCGCNLNGALESGFSGECFDNGGYLYSDKILNASTSSTDATKTNWNFIEYYVKMNSINAGASQFDGILQMWFNGASMINRSDIQLRTANHPTLKFHQFVIAPYIGDGSPVDQSFFIDDLKVGTGRLA